MSRSRGRNHRRPVHAGSIVSDGSSRIIRGEVLDLGELGGQERPLVQASFTYFGEKIRVNPELSEIDILDFMEAADKVNAKDPKALIMVKDYARAHIHPDDFERFWKLVKAHGQDTSAIMTLMWSVLDKISGNPTGGQSGSSAGQPAISNTSAAISPPPDDDRRAAFLRQIKRFEDMGNGYGVAMAAQIATAAEAQGIVLDDLEASAAPTA